MSGKRTIGSLLVRLGMDAKDADKSIKAFERNLKAAGKRMESVGRAMSIGFTAPFVAGMFKAIQAFDEEAQATRRLQVALGGTSKALLDQAAALQKVTVFADDAIINEQAWAAALGHSEAQIVSMTSAATGLAAGLGIDLHAAMEMLHKTTTGATGALGKLVPEVKSMTEAQLRSGEAVKLVEERFRGFAEAAAMTGAGPLKVLQNSFGDLMEQIGEAILPLVIALADKIKLLITWFQNLSPEVKQGAVMFGALVAAIGPLLTMLPTMVKWFMALLSPIAVVVAAIGALAGVVIAVAYNWEAFKDRTLTIWDNIKAGVVDGVNGVISAMNKVNKVMSLGMSNDMPLLSEPKKQGSGKPMEWMSMGSLFSEMSTDLINFLGLDKIIAQMKAADAAMSKLGTSADNTGESYKAAGEKMKAMAPAMGGFGISTTVSPVNFGTGRDIGPVSPMAEDDYAGLEKTGQAWVSLGEAVGLATSMIDNALASGGKGFGEYAKEALKAAAVIARAKMIEAAVNMIAGETKTKGLAGLIIGIAGATAAIAIMSSMVSGVKEPALAMGGMTTGPTSALIGDNRSGKEMVLPFERTSEFANMIGKQLGNKGGDNFHATVSAEGIELLMIKRSQNSARMGRPSIINF